MARRTPTVHQRRLGAAMKRLREERGMTVDVAAERIGYAGSTISRLENAQSSARPGTVRDLCELYGVKGKRRDDLTELCKAARKKGWWNAYSDLVEGPFIGLESAASHIHLFEPLLMPGLLQTAEYARAVIKAARPDLYGKDIDRAVEFRMERQKQVLQRNEPPDVWAVIDESVVRRPVGGTEVMRTQLRHIIDCAESSWLTLQLVPYDVGAHPAMDGGFVCLGFPAEIDSDMVYIENITSRLHLEQPEDLRRYSVIFDHLRTKALPHDDTLAYLIKLVKD